MSMKDCQEIMKTYNDIKIASWCCTQRIKYNKPNKKTGKLSN